MKNPEVSKTAMPVDAAVLARLAATQRVLGGYLRASWPDATGYDDHGRGPDAGSIARERVINQPSSAYPKRNEGGADTKEMFSDSRGSYTPERQALHEAIIEKYLKDAKPVEKPIAMIIGGGMGAGKSTLVKSEGLDKGNTVSVNVDEIRRDLPELRDAVAKLTKGDQGISTAMTHEEASDIGYQLMQRALAGKMNMTLDGTGDTTLSKLGSKVAQMRATGHEVVAEYVTVPVAEAMRRADIRAQTTDRRFVPPSAMAEVHRAVSDIFPEAIRQGLFDRARLWSTDVKLGDKPVLIASAKGKSLTVHDPTLWASFLAKGTKK